MPDSIPPLSYYYRNKIPLSERGKGRFNLLDIVQWKSKKGMIIEIVPYGMYPMKHERLKVRGYYREHESYIVVDTEGNMWWPRVGTIHLISHSQENEEKE